MKTKLTTQTLLTLLIALFLNTGIATAQDKTVASGTWTTKTHKIDGSWKIIDDGTSLKIKLYNLKTKNAPDLKIFLNPKPIAQLDNKTATNGAKLVAKLSSHKGNQTYEIPKNLKLTDFRSLIIHCEAYTKLWGGADL